MSKPIPHLGKLEKVDPREVWSHEALSFTPWLALPENLAQLGETLGLDLELEATEQSVGPFRADILCKQVGSDHWVLIENQLEKTDHSHLGQILTYAAGLDAVTVVWVSPQFTDEHRACLDWLNRSTNKDLYFFGIQLEVWRIADSLLAPRFHLVSQPNEWAESVASASASLGNSESMQAHHAYWSSLRERFVSRNGPLRMGKPQHKNWMQISQFGRGEFSLVARTNRAERRACVELYISGASASIWFRSLELQREDLEKRLGHLHFRDSAPRDRMISQYLDDADPTDREDWPRQHKWITDRLYAFFETFAPILSSFQPANSEDEPLTE